MTCRTDSRCQQQVCSTKYLFVICVIVLFLGSLSFVIQETGYMKVYFGSSMPSLSSKQPPTRICTRQEIRHGQWLPVTLDRPPYLPTKSKCYNQSTLGDMAITTTSWQHYQWQPLASAPKHLAINTTLQYDSEETCTFSQSWDQELFCHLANNQVIALVGDSLMLEQFVSLAMLNGIQGLNAHMKPKFKLQGKRYDQFRGFVMPVCNGRAEIAFFRHRWLAGLDKFLQWMDPDVVVVNRGAHYAPDDELLNGNNITGSGPAASMGIYKVLDRLQQWQTSCKADNNKNKNTKRYCLPIWRTTSPGHPNCMNFHQPATNVREMERLIETKSNSNPLRSYHHWQFRHQNELVLQAFENQTFSTGNFEYDVLHAYDVGILRPGSHVSTTDCLHNCDLSGTADAYNTMLLHLLRLHDAQQ